MWRKESNWGHSLFEERPWVVREKVYSVGRKLREASLPPPMISSSRGRTVDPSPPSFPHLSLSIHSLAPSKSDSCLPSPRNPFKVLIINSRGASNPSCFISLLHPLQPRFLTTRPGPLPLAPASGLWKRSLKLPAIRSPSAGHDLSGTLVFSSVESNNYSR